MSPLGYFSNDNNYKINGMMKRREFLGASLVPLLAAGQLLASEQGPGSTRKTDSDYLFVDERYMPLEEHVRYTVGTKAVLSVRADVTPVWNSTLKKTTRNASVILEGITSESFCFCLQKLLKHSHTLQVNVHRIDRDFYVWSIQATHNKYKRSIV
jgi:hypothetical protein